MKLFKEIYIYIFPTLQMKTIIFRNYFVKLNNHQNLAATFIIMHKFIHFKSKKLQHVTHKK